MEKIWCTQFDNVSTGRPYMIYPKVFNDNRGTFSEVLKDDDLKDIKQINRSTSCKMTFRGFHAQKAPFCQSKLVEALNQKIYDIIIDARPDSKSFGLIDAFLLDPKKQNKLYVPRGFLHSFFVPWYEYDNEEDAMFMYYCDNVYDHESEIGIDPMSVFEKLKQYKMIESKDLNDFSKNIEDVSKIVLSEKDLKGMNYDKFMELSIDEYKKTGKCWYKDN